LLHCSAAWLLKCSGARCVAAAAQLLCSAAPLLLCSFARLLICIGGEGLASACHAVQQHGALSPLCYRSSDSTKDCTLPRIELPRQHSGGAQQGTVVTLGALRPGPRRRLEAGVSTVCHDMDAGCGYRCTIRGCPEQGAGLRVLPSKASIHKGALQLSSATASRGVRCCRAKSLLEGTGGRGACALRVCHACTAALSRAAWRCTLTASLAPLGRAIPKRALCPTRATYSHPRSDDSLSGGPPSCNGA